MVPWLRLQWGTWRLPDGPVAETPFFRSREPGFDPWSGTRSWMPPLKGPACYNGDLVQPNKHPKKDGVSSMGFPPGAPGGEGAMRSRLWEDCGGHGVDQRSLMSGCGRRVAGEGGWCHL